MEGPDKGILVSGPPVNKDKEEKYCFGSCLLIGFLNPHVWGPDKINSCNSCLLSGPPSIVIGKSFIPGFWVDIKSLFFVDRPYSKDIL